MIRMISILIIRRLMAGEHQHVFQIYLACYRYLKVLGMNDTTLTFYTTAVLEYTPVLGDISTRVLNLVVSLQTGIDQCQFAWREMCDFVATKSQR